MVANSTRDFAFEILEAQQDMTIKYTIFLLVILYAVLLWYIQKKHAWDSIPKIIFKLFSNLYVYITIVFLPMFTIMLFRDYAAISLWTLLIQLYGAMFVIAALGLLIFGWQKCLEMFGIEVDIGQLYQDKPLKGENK